MSAFLNKRKWRDEVTVVSVFWWVLWREKTSCGAREVPTRDLEVTYPKFPFFSLTTHSALFSHYPNHFWTHSKRCGAVPSALLRRRYFFTQPVGVLCSCACSKVEEGTPTKNPNLGREVAVDRGWRPRWVLKVLFCFRLKHSRSCMMWFHKMSFILSI